MNKSASTSNNNDAEDNDSDKRLEQQLYCPITQQVMLEPVSASDGHVYEKEAIEKWLKTKTTSPMTGATIENPALFPSYFVKGLIDDYLKKHTHLRDEVYFPSSIAKQFITACCEHDVTAVKKILADHNGLLLTKKHVDLFLGGNVLHVVLNLSSDNANDLKIVEAVLDQSNKTGDLMSLLAVENNEKEIPIHLIVDFNILTHVIKLIGLDAVVKLNETHTPPENCFYFECIDKQLWEVIASKSERDESEHTKNETNISEIDVRQVEMCLQLGAAPNAKQGEANSTALHEAAWQGDLQVVRLLLEYRAEVTTLDAWHNTPLHIAAQAGKLAVVKLLLDNEAEVSAVNEDGDTPLHLAALEGHRDVVEELVKRGADVNKRGKDQETALHCAVSRDHASTVWLLLDQGANYRIRNCDHRRPTDLVTQNNTELVNKINQWIEVHETEQLNMIPKLQQENQQLQLELRAVKAQQMQQQQQIDQLQLQLQQLLTRSLANQFETTPDVDDSHTGNNNAVNTSNNKTVT